MVSAFNLIDASTGAVLQQLNDGGVVDLSAYTGHKLNIEVVMSPQKGSILFTLDDFSRIENRAPYRIGGDFGNVAFPALTAGVHTLTGITYNQAWGKGEVGNIYTMTLTVTNGTTSANNQWLLTHPPPTSRRWSASTCSNTASSTGGCSECVSNAVPANRRRSGAADRHGLLGRTSC